MIHNASRPIAGSGQSCCSGRRRFTRITGKAIEKRGLRQTEDECRDIASGILRKEACLGGHETGNGIRSRMQPEVAASENAQPAMPRPSARESDCPQLSSSSSSSPASAVSSHCRNSFTWKRAFGFPSVVSSESSRHTLYASSNTMSWSYSW